MSIQDLIQTINTQLPDNNQQLITEAILRGVLENMVNTLSTELRVFNINASDVTNNGDGTYTLASVENELMGALAFDEDLNIYQYNGTHWTLKTSGASAAPVQSVNSQTGAVSLDADDIDDTTTTNKFVTQSEKDSIEKSIVKKQVLVDANLIEWDTDEGVIAELTIGGDRVLNAPTNLKPGLYSIIVKQDAVGSHTLSFDDSYLWVGGTSPTLTAAAHSVDVFNFISDGNFLYGTSRLDYQSIGLSLKASSIHYWPLNFEYTVDLLLQDAAGSADLNHLWGGSAKLFVEDNALRFPHEATIRGARAVGLSYDFTQPWSVDGYASKDNAGVRSYVVDIYQDGGSEHIGVAMTENGGWWVYLSGGITVDVDNAIPYTINTWYYWYLEWDGTKARLYVDGVLDKEITPTSLSTNLDSIIIGSYYNGTNDLYGYMKNVGVYNRVLTPDEITWRLSNSVFNANPVPDLNWDGYLITDEIITAPDPLTDTSYREISNALYDGDDESLFRWKVWVSKRNEITGDVETIMFHGDDLTNLNEYSGNPQIASYCEDPYVVIDPSNGDYYLFSENSPGQNVIGRYKSTDRGRNWIFQENWGDSDRPASPCVLYDDPNTLYMWYERNTAPKNLHLAKSTDNGATWINYGQVLAIEDLPFSAVSIVVDDVIKRGGVYYITFHSSSALCGMVTCTNPEDPNTYVLHDNYLPFEGLQHFEHDGQYKSLFLYNSSTVPPERKVGSVYLGFLGKQSIT